MSNTRYTAEFKAKAVKQATEHGHGVVEYQNDCASQTRADMSG